MFYLHRLSLTILIVGLGLAVSGCESKATQDLEKPTTVKSPEMTENNLTTKSDHFQSHYKGAKEFSRLWAEWTRLRENGHYEEALELLEHAYNDVAFGRAEKGVALWETAKTYEAMSNYELAANFYEGAAKTTMNPEQAEEFNQKAKELRQKATVALDKIRK